MIIFYNRVPHVVFKTFRCSAYTNHSILQTNFGLDGWKRICHMYVKSSVVSHGMCHTVCPTILNETSNGAWGSMMVFRSFIILLLGITLVIVFGENWKAIKISTVQWLKINDLLIKILYSDFTAILWLYDFKLRSKTGSFSSWKTDRY